MPLKFSRKQLIIVGGGAVLLVAVFVLIFLNLRPKANTAQAVKLAVWGTEDRNGVKNLIAAYPNATVSYFQVDPANYESQLLSALAAGTGPDVFEISNRALPKWKSVLAPLPAAYAQTFGILQLQNAFPDVVAQDFVSGGQIYGLPLSIDTLAMIYNKDLFNSAGIAVPPATWDDLDADIAKLRAVNAQGQLTRAAAAIGGSTVSIPYAPDILSLLMLQNGTQMTGAQNTTATFALQENGNTGLAAFNFYLQFANGSSPYYTWNDGMGDATAGFVAGKVAIIFAYQADLAAIKTKAPFLNIGVAAMPQAKGANVAVNYPKYNGFVVAKAGQSAAAWPFVLYLTATPGNGTMYQDATGRPPALRANIQADQNDPGLSVFAAQALTARSWYEADDAAIDGILGNAIQSALNGAADPAKALNIAQQSVTVLMGGQR